MRTDNHTFHRIYFCVILTAFVVGATSETIAQNRLLIGSDTTSITPDEPVALAGQFHMRIAEEVRHPLRATAVAIEGRNGDGRIDQAIMVACDLIAVREGILEKVRERVEPRLSDSGFAVDKLLINATHTHTAPVMKEENRYPIPEEGVMQPSEYVDFLVSQLSDLVVEAWQNRASGGVSWAMSHAVIGHNRRAVYYNGEAQMYGATDTNNFSHIEGSEDHGLELLFFWNDAEELTGISINVACPSQVIEGKSVVSSDFWYEVRRELRQRYSEDIFIYAMAGAAGDQSPHLMLRRRAEKTLRERRHEEPTSASGRDETVLKEVADRIAHAIDYVYAGAERNIRTNVPMQHQVQAIDLPIRQVTRAEAELAKFEIERLSSEPQSEHRDVQISRHEEVLKRFRQQNNGSYSLELHAIRLGDVTLVTNPFELFTDYGSQMKARSRAEQTFVIQLANSSAGYLPTERAVTAGGYGATVREGIIGPEGGKVLVDRTVELIDSMWRDE